MAIRYADLGPEKTLSQIVFAGSHDAGVNDGPALAKAQALNILGQARAGVRLFDLRIAGFADKDDDVELKAFHVDDKLLKTKAVQVPAGEPPKTQSKLKIARFGAEGLTLKAMLQDAKTFVEDEAQSEFLILKFDKCKNWLHIANMCRDELGSCIYESDKSVNSEELRELAGKVVCAFTLDGWGALKSGEQQSITPIYNHYKDSKSKPPTEPGLHYWGKGGTNPMTPLYAVTENYHNQEKIFAKSRGKEGAVLGMMYWTTTGLLGSIKARDDKSWNRNGLPWSKDGRLADLWKSCAGKQSGIIPNIVMVDFADDKKCQDIYDLNTKLNPGALQEAPATSSREDNSGA